ncbi:MAG: prepilin-type N-terminal cleavage/methylation domain-containing protein [Planctomycetota bacterium]
MNPDMALQGLYGAAWCLVAFYCAALYHQMRDLPPGHVIFSLLFLLVACSGVSVITGFFAYLVPDLLLGVFLYCVWASGVRGGIRNIALTPASRFAAGFLSVLFLLVVLLLGCATIGGEFIILWPFASAVVIMLLPRSLKVPMLKSILPMGEYMGWDDIFPPRLRYRPRKPPSGFVLIEVVIAVAVLGISLSAIFALTSCRRELRAATERAAMVRIAAQSEMERLKSRPFDSIEVGASWTFTIQLPEGAQTGKVFVEKDSDPLLKRVRVVAEEGRMEIERIELVTLVAARKGAGP